DARPHRFALSVDQHAGVAVEFDVRPIVAPDALGSPHDNRLADLALLDGRMGNRLFNGDHDDVAQAAVAPPRPPEDMKAHDFLGPGIVGDIQSAVNLNHMARAFFTISTTRKCLSLLNGRLSTIRTWSPVWHSFFSSCALSRVMRRMTLPYLAWCVRRFTTTTTVFSILSLTTSPPISRR